MGTDHSIVSNNSVFNNTGGILITDETRQASSNLIEGNTVSSNPYACGITMASHAPAAATGRQTSFGVYQNTVSKNVSTYNGLAAGGGAGVGIFTPNPGTVNYGNVVVGNTLTGNGLPGVALHSHAPNQVLSDNIIVGNRISGNGPDAGTPGPTGISILGVIAGTPTMLPIYGVVISGNEIDGEAADIVVQTSAQVTIQFNSLQGGATGIANIGTGVVQATQNWWGCSGGPGATGCSAMTGTVAGAPWLANPIAR
jgi:parallel beta-helix repeat protein